MEFSILVPEMAVVYFQVMDDVNTGEDKPVAQFALPFTSIQEGTQDNAYENILTFKSFSWTNYW